MLIDFILNNREKIVARTRTKVKERRAPRPTSEELEIGVPLFLEQLVGTLLGSRPLVDEPARRRVSDHAGLLLNRGYTVSQVIYDYGDICQALTELADEAHEVITASEFCTLNKSLDRAMAEAVTEYARLRDESAAAGERERSGAFAQAMRNKIAAAQLAFLAVKTGRAPARGNVSAIVTRSLQGMTTLLNRALVEVRLDAGHVNRERVALHRLIDTAEVEALLDAEVRGLGFRVEPAPRGIDLNVDAQLLNGAIANLLDNAFKFTRPGGEVSLRTSVKGDHVHIAVADACGGLPQDTMTELFAALRQRGNDRGGLGLGLFITRRAVEACGGTLDVRDAPGHGCAFVIDLPVLPPAALAPS